MPTPPTAPQRSIPFAGVLDFTSLPPAANNAGVMAQCNPLVAGQNYFYMVSDGTYWRPVGGDQILYNLSAQIDMAVNNSDQLLVSVPLPTGLLPDGRSTIEVVQGWDKLLGTSDTLTTTTRIGAANTTSDATVFPPSAIASTNITMGFGHRFARISATEVRKQGSPTVTAFSSVSANVRTAAVTVGSMDTVTNYLGIYGRMTTGSTEKGELHALTVRLIG
jgi:hypothetical protein